MGIALPCQSINSGYAWGKLGVFRIAAIGSGPPPGGLIINGGTWTVSDHDPSGIDVSSLMAGVGAGDVLTIETSTGSNQLTVISKADGAGFTTITGTQANVVGIVDSGQATALWIRGAATERCENGTTTTVNFCALKSANQLSAYLALHPELVALANAYIAEHCADPPPPTDYCALREDGTLDEWLAAYPNETAAAHAYIAAHCVADYCAKRADGTLDQWLMDYPHEAEAAMAHVLANCPTACEMTVEQMQEWVDDHPDQADETLAFVEANCSECASVNWLRGYIAARDPDPMPTPPMPVG